MHPYPREFEVTGFIFNNTNIVMIKRELASRMEKIEELLKRRNLKGIILFNHYVFENPNFIYTTNCNELGFYILNKNEPSLFTFNSKVKTPIKRVLIKKLQNLPRLKGSFGIDEKYIQTNIYHAIKKITKTRLVDITNDLEQIRSIKSVHEITTMRQACRIAEKVYNGSERFMHEHNEEIVVRSDIEKEMAKHGVYPSFPTIVASQENIINPHHVAGKKIIEKPILVDFGIKYEHYCTDATRTIGSKYEKLIIQIMNAVEGMLRPCTKVSTIDRFVRKKMGNLQKYFTTSLGHGVGLAVHEFPTISSQSKDVLREGMVVTIEPGIYIRNGIRIENMYLITKDGCENLTNF